MLNLHYLKLVIQTVNNPFNYQVAFSYYQAVRQQLNNLIKISQKNEMTSKSSRLLLLIAVPILFSTIFLLSSLLSCCFVSCSTPSGSRSFALPFQDYSLHLQYIRSPHSIVRTHSHHYLLKPELVQILLWHHNQYNYHHLNMML